MEFRNLTPFSVMNYKMLDVDDVEHHVIVMKVGYALEPTDNANHYFPRLLTDFPLELQDKFVNSPNTSSVICESDLAPLKPRCDVLLRGIAYAPEGKPVDSILASLTMTDKNEQVLLNKSLRCFGPRQFILDQDNTWQITKSAPIKQLPIDYRYAFGGECKVYQQEELANPIPEDALFPRELLAEHPEKENAPIAHGTDEYNPLGQGFITPWFQHAKAISEFSAPQIETLDEPVSADWVIKQLSDNPVTAHQPAGFGAIGRAWLPRRLLAGTYDAQWLEARHPYLPKDFDFSYWNCAPEDQQIDFPKSDFSLSLKNFHPLGDIQTTLPGHRPFILLRMENGLFIPIHLNLDTLLIDTEKMQLSLTYRMVLQASIPIRVCEARFEMDPNAPLVRFADSSKEKQHG